MANNNIGLQFNPLAGLGQWGNQQSVPTTADEYFAPQVPTLTIPEWKPERLQKAQQFVADVTSKPQEEWNPLGEYNKWSQGLRGLDEPTFHQWEEDNYAKTQGHDEVWKDRLWRNQKFVEAFGLDVFQSMPNKDDRDALYKDYLLGEAIGQKYYKNDNLDQLMSLTPEGKMELLKSDYKSDWQLNQENEEAKDKGWFDYSLGERWNALTSQTTSQGATGMGFGSIAGGVAGGAAGTIVGIGIGGASGMISGALTGITHPEDADAINALQRKTDNEDILNKITVADNERKKEQSQDEINNLWSNYLKAYQNGQITSEDIDKMFDEVALSGKRTATDELGNTEQYDYQGSNYYTAFKDSDEFEHFGTIDKLKYLAQTQILGRKYGQGSALQALEQDMQNYISDNQSGWTWAGNSLKNVWVGGVANLALNNTALGALGAKMLYGEEGLANYLKGKDASGNGEDNWKWVNPMYLSKIDQYNTFDEDAIAKAEGNGGISEYNNIVTPGTENDFWSWNTLNEAVRMNKFAWSDLLKNLALGKLVRGATRLAGGVELAPGVLATESTAASQAINKVGALGVLNASSLGIDAAYGMQTYEEVLRQNNERLDNLIKKDTDAEVQRRIQTPEALKEFRTFVDAENQRRRQRAGETGKWIPVDEAEAWKDYITHTENVVRKEQEALHAEDRQQAENDAANAYAADASIEHLRMATTNGVFKSYLFDKGTLNALRGNNPYVRTTTKNGLYALGKNATRKKALGTLGMNVWGGFQSNYFDDVTVGFAEGFGIQDYNNYLLQKYNPAAYGSVMDEYVNPYLAGMMGASNSMREKRSFLDGTIGALGSVFTAMPNVQGMVSHRERMKEAAEAAKKNSQEKNVLSWQEMASDFINNPVLQAYADAKAATRMTEAEIKRVNDIIKENGYSFDNIVETATALNGKSIAKEGTSVMEAEDAKDREAFTLASSLLSLKNSLVIANAQAEPSKADWSKKKRAASIIGKGLNTMLGVQVFNEAESSYTRAMQALEDAASIGETDNAETIARQQELVQTFLGLDANKNALENMSQEEKVAFAQERLKKNATGLLDMMDRTENLQKKFEKSLQARLHPDLQQQLMYQYVLNDRWESRLNELEQQITGEESHDDYYIPNAVIAKYGSMKGYERAKNAQAKRVEEAQKAYDKAEVEANKENDPTKSIVENARQKAMRLFKKKTAADNLKKEKSAMSKIEADEASVKEVVDTNNGILAENILRLNADDRLRMLDDFYRSDYSEAQQFEIDRAKRLLMRDGTPINEAMERVRDATILTHRIEDNTAVAKRIMENPIEANQMQQALIENRRKAVIDYFNDKLVAEVFNDFAADPEATVSKDKAVQRAERYSTAVLNGVLRTIEKETARKRKAEELDDKALSVMEDGVKAVLNVRDNRLKETVDMDGYIRKTKKVDHKQFIYPAGEKFGTQITEERELSQNDKRLLNAALDYAAERDIPVDELADKVDTEDFNNYLKERNHAYQLMANPMTGEVMETNVGTVENRINPVSPEYMKGLLNDVVESFKANQDKVKKAKEEKPVAAKPESVATKPVETKGAKPGSNEREEEVRPDEVDPNDPFGLKKKKAAQPTSQPENKPAESKPASTPIVTNDRNAQILEDATVLNSNILEDLGVLLDEIDRAKMNDNTRGKLKDIISSLVGSKAIAGIKSLQNMMMEEALLTNGAEAPGIDAKATGIASLDIADIKARKANKDGITVGNGQTGNNNNNPNTTSTPQAPTPAILETRDLDALMNYPVWSDYIKGHNVVGFLQKLSDLWNREVAAWRENKTQGHLHQSQVVFIYDPALAESVRGSIEENGGYYNPEISAPVVMALEVTDKNKSLVDDESQLFTIKDKADGKVKQYQAIGFMPASEVSTADSETMKATANRMGALRSRINFDDKDAHVLRYAPNNDTSKYNGTIIKTNIEKVSSHTEEDRIPHATEDTPKVGVQMLMDENNQSATESFVKSTDEEQKAYDEAKQKGGEELRKTSLYKKLRKAFIDRLIKRERKSANPDDQNTKELNFRIQKGTNDTYPKIVLIKKIGETLDKNSGRPIADLLREVDDTGSNAKEVVESNSRFKKLFNQITKLQLGKGLFNQEGNVVNKAMYDKAIHEFEESIRKTIENNLHVDDMTVRVEVSDGIPTEKTVSINVFSGDVNNVYNLLATLTTKYDGQISQAEYASFLKDLILDKDGNTRSGLRDSRFERVKWQVNYEDANTANDNTKTALEKKVARDNLEDLYDDGVFEMQVTKLAYPSRSVTVGINPTMKSRLYPERTKAEPAQAAPEATETKASFEAETATGKVDGDTGMRTEAPTRESILSGIPRVIMDTISKILNDSKSRNLSDNSRHYNIAGQLWSRVTSIKYALDKMGDRFDPNSKWAVPSSLIGNSFDEFGRDVFNGVFDSMTDQERTEAFGTYDNSTEKNYSQGYMALKAFESRLRGKNQVIIATGTRENPGHITAKGMLDVTVKGENGIETKKVRVAGTVDVLTVDDKGNLHIYDFKTQHNSLPTKEGSESKGYDRQLSMYAKFLEDEYGLKVASINIIPIKAEYETPRTNDDYKESRPGSNQLLKKNAQGNYEEFKSANFEVGKEFELNRLPDSELVASFDKMTDAEKEAIVEAIQDQSETPSTEITKTDEIVDSKPEVETDSTEEEEEEGGRSRRGRLGRRKSNPQVDTSNEAIAEAINPTDEGGLLARLKDLENACGGKKR